MEKQTSYEKIQDKETNFLRNEKKRIFLKNKEKFLKEKFLKDNNNS